MKRTVSVLLLLACISTPVFAKSLASQKINNLKNKSSIVIKTSTAPLSEQVGSLKNDENSKGVSSSAGTDKTEDFISHVSKMLKLVEDGGKFNADVIYTGSGININNHGDENITTLTNLLSNSDKKIELNVHAVLLVENMVKDSNNAEIEKVYKIISSYTTMILNFDILGAIKMAGLSNASLGKYLLDMALCVKHGEKLSDELTARPFKYIDQINLAFDTPTDTDKVVYYTGAMEDVSIGEFKQAVEKSGGKNNKTQILSKLDDLLTKVKAADPFNKK
ncbi:MAG: hypothetical protein V1647_04475 [Pseudomonadota bacterium]